MIGRTLFRAWARSAAPQPDLRLVAVPTGLGVVIDRGNGLQTSVVLNREQAQRLRHALTSWLVDAAPEAEVRAS